VNTTACGGIDCGNPATVAVGAPLVSRPLQIRMSASTHAALTEDEWRRSVHQVRDAEHGAEESTGARHGRNVPSALGRVDCDELRDYATLCKRDARRCATEAICLAQHGIGSNLSQLAETMLCLAGTVMLPALKFSLDRIQLRHHPLLFAVIRPTVKTPP
jgi:hypothetical protein